MHPKLDQNELHSRIWNKIYAKSKWKTTKYQETDSKALSKIALKKKTILRRLVRVAKACEFDFELLFKKKLIKIKCYKFRRTPLLTSVQTSWKRALMPLFCIYWLGRPWEVWFSRFKAPILRLDCIPWTYWRKEILSTILSIWWEPVGGTDLKSDCRSIFNSRADFYFALQLNFQ